MQKKLFPNNKKKLNYKKTSDPKKASSKALEPLIKSGPRQTLNLREALTKPAGSLLITTDSSLWKVLWKKETIKKHSTFFRFFVSFKAEDHDDRRIIKMVEN